MYPSKKIANIIITYWYQQKQRKAKPDVALSDIVCTTAVICYATLLSCKHVQYRHCFFGMRCLLHPSIVLTTFICVVQESLSTVDSGWCSPFFFYWWATWSWCLFDGWFILCRKAAMNCLVHCYVPPRLVISNFKLEVHALWLKTFSANRVQVLAVYSIDFVSTVLCSCDAFFVIPSDP